MSHLVCPHNFLEKRYTGLITKRIELSEDIQLQKHTHI